MRHCLIALALVIAALAFAATDKDVLKLQGPVKSVTAKISKLSQTNGKWIEGPKWKSGHCLFNRDGNLLEETAYPDPTSVSEDAQVETLTFDYDAKGRKIGENRPGGRSHSTVRWVHTYDDRHNTGEVRRADDGSGWLSRRIQYDSEGREAESRSYAPDGGLSALRVHSYGRNGATCRTTAYRSGKAESVTTTHYDKNGLYLDDKEVQTDGVVRRTCHFERLPDGSRRGLTRYWDKDRKPLGDSVETTDRWGRETSYSWHDQAGRPGERRVVTPEYDRRNNVIKTYTVSERYENGKMIVENRTIGYYSVEYFR